MNMLGIREKEKYGSYSLDDINEGVEKLAQTLGIQVEFFQSNTEGEIINKIHSAYKRCDGIIINPAGFTYYSIGILDALYAVNMPTVEVHMTNIFAREEFRGKTITAAGCIGVIAGFGRDVYPLAVNALHKYLNAGR